MLSSALADQRHLAFSASDCCTDAWPHPAAVTDEINFLPAIEIARLKRDRPLRNVDLTHVSVLADVLDRCPPILVGMPGFVLLDGYMRVAAAERTGRLYLPAVLAHGTAAELLEVAVRANASHGLPLSRMDRGHVVDRLIEEAPDWSNYRIAAAAGVCEKTVRNHRRRVERVAAEPTAEIPENSAETPQDGAESPHRVHSGRLRSLLRGLLRKLLSMLD